MLECRYRLAMDVINSVIDDATRLHQAIAPLVGDIGEHGIPTGIGEPLGPVDQSYSSSQYLHQQP